ncbi:MAG: efflux RND transporter periplasmic adaptor subunit [Rubrivivax sp.]
MPFPSLPPYCPPGAAWASIRSAALPVFVLCIGLLAGCGKGSGSAPPATAAARAASAPVLLLAPEDLQSLQHSLLASGPVVTGTVQPQRRADLRAEVAAVVVQVTKENGEPVRRGDLLMRLDDTSIRDGMTSAEAAVQAADQSYAQSQRQAQRIKTLQGQGMMSMQALEDADMRRNQSQSDLVASQARVVAARQQLRRTEVRAPFDGVVSDRKASVGDTTQIGKELVKVIDPGSMRFEGLVSSDRLQELKVGQAVGFKVNGMGDTEFKGTLRRIDASANAATRQVEVIVDFDKATAAPRVAGLFAEGRIETGGSEVLMLPDRALARSGEQTWVWRVQGNTLQKAAVKLGPRDPRSGEFPVESGLADGQRILRSPSGSLVDGQAVEFAAGAASAPAAGASAGTTAAAGSAALAAK